MMFFHSWLARSWRVRMMYSGDSGMSSWMKIWDFGMSSWMKSQASWQHSISHGGNTVGYTSHLAWRYQEMCSRNALTRSCGTQKQQGDMMSPYQSLVDINMIQLLVLSKTSRINSIKNNKMKFIFRITDCPFFGGYLVGKWYAIDLEKVQAIQEMKPPHNLQDLQSFIGPFVFVCGSLWGKSTVLDTSCLYHTNSISTKLPQPHPNPWCPITAPSKGILWTLGYIVFTVVALRSACL